MTEPLLDRSTRRRTPVPALTSADATTGRPHHVSALDVLVAPDPVDATGSEPEDVVTALLRVDEHGVTDHDRDQLTELHRWQRQRHEAEARYKALGEDIRVRTAELLERRIERDWYPLMPATVSDQGEPIQPCIRSSIYPRFRADPDTGERFSKVDVVPALVDAGLAHLVEPGYDSTVFAASVRDAVKDWRSRIGEDGVVDADGNFVDAHGTVLTGAEREDPTADALGLHPALRRHVEPTVITEIRFSTG